MGPESRPASPAEYPRDMVGYGAYPRHARWPDDARILVQFVINFKGCIKY